MILSDAERAELRALIAANYLDSTIDTALFAWLETYAAALDRALGRCQAVIQCHRETGHEGGHEACEENG